MLNVAVCLTLQELLESSSDPESGGEEEKAHGSVIDMEDLGTVMKKAKVGAVFRSAPVRGAEFYLKTAEAFFYLLTLILFPPFKFWYNMTDAYKNVFVYGQRLALQQHIWDS